MKRTAAWFMTILMILQVLPVGAEPASNEWYQVVSEEVDTPVFHAVRFMAEENEVAVAYVADGGLIDEVPEAPEIAGKRFLGWYREDVRLNPNDAITADLEYTAIYTETDQKLEEQKQRADFLFEDTGAYAEISIFGTHKKNQVPTAGRISLSDASVLEAWMADNIKNNTSLTLEAVITAVPGKGSLDAWQVMNGQLSVLAGENLRPGDRVVFDLSMKGAEGLALTAETEGEEVTLVDGALYANEHLYLTGKIPGNGIIEVTPMRAGISGEEVIAAYDITIYANEKQQKKGKPWQPAGDKVQVHFFNEAFTGELNVYHIQDGTPEYIATVEAEDGWIEFEASSFSIYAVTRSIEETIEIDGSTYKITVNFDHRAEIPEGAELKVTEVSGETYLSDTATALGWTENDEIFYTKFLDIAIVKDDIEIEPAAPVDVTVELLDVKDGAEALEVVHIADNGEVNKVDSAASADGVVTFTVDSFSVYGFGSILSSLLSWTTDAVSYTLQGFSALLNPTCEAVSVTLEEGLEAINAYNVHSTLGSLLNLLYVKVTTALNLDVRENIVVYGLHDGELGEVLYEGENLNESIALGDSDGFAVVKDSGFRRMTFALGKVELDGMMPKGAAVKAADVTDDYADFDKEAALVAAYEISIDENGTEYQPDKAHPVDVTIQVGETEANPELHLWHIKADGTREEIMDFTVADGKVSFAATGFSVYVVTETILTKTVEASDGNTYEISVTYQKSSGIPMRGTDLLVSEVMPGNTDYEEYLAAAAGKVGAKVENIRFSRIFDIQIVDENDRSAVYEPTGDVTVSIRLIGEPLEEYANLDVLHFMRTRKMHGFTVYDMDSTVDGETVQFTTDSFSVYVVAGYVLETTIEIDGQSYKVAAVYNDDAGLPGDAKLEVSEINDLDKMYAQYLNGTAEVLGVSAGDLDYLRLLDISIVGEDGIEYKPNDQVKITVELMDKTEAGDLRVVHFGEVTEEIQAQTEGDMVTFTTDGFSVFSFVIEKTILSSDGNNYIITVTCGADSGIPEDAGLAVEEILGTSERYEEYVSKTEDALGMEEGSTEYIRLFDISIVDKDGQKIQPAEGHGVTVRIGLADSANEELSVVHFADETSEGEIIANSTENGEAGTAVEFQADSFSVYSIVDAPAPKPIDEAVSTIEEIEPEQEYYLSIARTGTNYMTSTSVLNSGVYELQGTTNKSAGEKWLFEFPEPGKICIYYLDSENGKKYLNVDTNRNISFSGNPQPLLIEETTNAQGTFYIYTVIGNNNYALSVRSNRNFFFEGRNNGANANERVVLTKHNNDLYGLDGKTFGIAYHNDSTIAAAMMAGSKTVSNQNRLAGLDMLMRADVLTNDGVLLVAEDSDIQEWTFESIDGNQYYLRTTVDGVTKYLLINRNNVSLTENRDSASAITATPGTGSNSGKWHFTVNNYSLNFSGSAANGFNAANNNNATTWMNLVERSVLTEDDFVNYSARKISASDEFLSATEKDENGEILTDEDGNPVYKSKKARVIIYTRVWNDNTKKYEYYAVDHDGSLVRVYDSGDLINWVGNRVNSALWEFTEYTNADGTPSWYYELENTAYPNTFLVPQSSGIISNHPVGLNLEGRQDGFDYTSIVAWDEAAYAYSGLKVEGNKVVTCPLGDADDFYFAVMTPVAEEAAPVTTVATVDNRVHGITLKMIDFQNSVSSSSSRDRDRVQTEFFGRDSNEAGLLSTSLESNGYPWATEAGRSLKDLFSGMTSANHLFLQSVYNESGYFEYDSTQNFAHLNGNGNFTVYDQIGAIVGSGEHRNTREHGQFMPYNDISPEKGYAIDSSGDIITNRMDVNGTELPDSNPRKGEKLYLIGDNTKGTQDPNGDGVDYFFGMELSASFTQTPSGLDNWGHDIIFEFTGDDDFWFYVDGELVLDLGGVHSAMAGSVNFRTGEVKSSRGNDTLYNIFKSHYEARGMSAEDVTAKLNEIFELKDGNYVFSDYSTHTMKMFYMERGAGASNLKMRFNLASVQPGTVELTKKLTGTEGASNKLMQYPYQIWYATAEYQKNPDGSYVVDGQGNRIIDHYNNPELLTQPSSNNNLTGQVYAVYKGTKKLIPYKASMTIDGQTYQNVFLLKAGETAVLNFPENTYQYKIVECGVNTEVYEHVFVNGDEVFGKPYNNTDGEPTTGGDGGTGDGSGNGAGDEAGSGPTETYNESVRSDFGISYKTTTDRPRVEYNNQVPPEVMRTLSFRKVVYDANGEPMNPKMTASVSATFSFRLYLGNEFADQSNLSLANKYSYYVKDPNGYYCRWNSADRKFSSLNISNFEGAGGLAEYLDSASSSERAAIVFTTSIYGSISNIPAGYTVEVRDLIVGTKYKVEERGGEIPKGFTRRDNDGYVRTDLNPDYVYYTEDGVYGKHELTETSTITAEAISDTIASKTESPVIEVRNQEGWGLTAEKVWTDKDFMTHDPIYLAVYLKNADGTLGDLVDGSVRRLNTDDTEVYWFFQDLRVNNASSPYTFDQFIIREVNLTGTPSVNESTGAVTGYDSITPVADGGNVSVSGRTISGTSRTETYTVSYQPGDSTGQNANIRTDTVTNSRPGIQIYKTNWEGTEYLSDAVFTLKDSDGNDVGAATYTSDVDGLVTTAYLSEGTYTLTEIKTPVGYAAPDEPITLTVTNTEPDAYDLAVIVGQTTYYIVLNGPDGLYTAAAATETDMARITIRNHTVQELKVVKVSVDGSERTVLSGVHFALYDQVRDTEGNLRPAYLPKDGYDDLVTDEYGVLTAVTMDLRGGTYYLREKETPNGYKKLANDLCFTVGEDGLVKINTDGYTNWLKKTASPSGVVSYQIDIENTPLGITLRKTDEKGNTLSGAQFTLSRKNGDNYEPVSEYGLGENGLIDLTARTEMTFTGLSNGDYKLTETHVPAGHTIVSQNIYFKVAEGAVTLTDENGEPENYSDVSLDDDNTTIIVKNITLVAPTGISFHTLPSLILLAAGLLLLLLIFRRKRKKGK